VTRPLIQVRIPNAHVGQLHHTQNLTAEHALFRAQRDLMLHCTWLAPSPLCSPALPLMYSPHQHPQARFAQWGPVLQLTPGDIDYSNDGIMVSPAADVFGRGVFHYVRALAYASAAAHETGGRWKGGGGGRGALGEQEWVAMGLTVTSKKGTRIAV
jgi:hypothetical protein